MDIMLFFYCFFPTMIIAFSAGFIAENSKDQQVFKIKHILVTVHRIWGSFLILCLMVSAPPHLSLTGRITLGCMMQVLLLWRYWYVPLFSVFGVLLIAELFGIKL